MWQCTQPMGSSAWNGRARQHFMESDAQRIIIGAAIYSPIHPARLFRRHVRQRAFQQTGIDRLLFLPLQYGGQAEINEPEFSAGAVQQEVARIDILVDDAAAMDVADDGRPLDGEIQKRCDIRSAGRDDFRRRPAVECLQYQRPAIMLLLQGIGPGNPSRLDWREPHTRASAAPGRMARVR
jgi:hypothetical protein